MAWSGPDLAAARRHSERDSPSCDNLFDPEYTGLTFGPVLPGTLASCLKHDVQDMIDIISDCCKDTAPSLVLM